MKNAKISKLWDQLHSSYWFIPAVMAVVATALAFTMLTLDRTDKVNIDYWWVYTGGADGARSLLEAIAVIATFTNNSKYQATLQHLNFN